MKEKYFNAYNDAYKYCMVYSNFSNKDNVTISYDNGKYYVGIDPAIDWETNLERKSRERNERINLILGE